MTLPSEIGSNQAQRANLNLRFNPITPLSGSGIQTTWKRSESGLGRN